MAATTRDGFLGGRLLLEQPAAAPRAGDDAALLAAAVPARPGERVLDAGAGVGAVALALALRCPDVHVTALEIDPASAGMAARNAEAAGLAGRVAVSVGDLARLPEALRRQSFDRIVTNPPWRTAARSQASPDPDRARAHVGADLDVGDWLACCLVRLRPHGTLTAILPVDRLDDALAALAGRAGGVALLPLWPAAARPARRIVLQATKGGRGPLRLLPGLVLHDADGRYTAAAEAVLRDLAPLPLA